MKSLEIKILEFDNWSQPWTFYEFVSSEKSLNISDLNLFNEVWTKAGAYEFWNNADLIQCCKASQTYISENYQLKNNVIRNIVRALSYRWK
ncbi:MAG: hypothetical protein Q8K92_13015 [Leadbetterella sp.]|nr:hypothetical protein [Leadbetterella sp.]